MDPHSCRVLHLEILCEGRIETPSQASGGICFHPSPWGDAIYENPEVVVGFPVGMLACVLRYCPCNLRGYDFSIGLVPYSVGCLVAVFCSNLNKCV